MSFSPDRQHQLRVVTVYLGFAMALAGADSHVTASDFRPKRSSRPTARHGRPQASRSRGVGRAPEAPPTHQELKYHFSKGQTFAYAVTIEWKASGRLGRSGRLSGRPYFRVNYSDELDTVLMVIGRLRYEETAGDGTLQKIPAKDYWLGTTVILHAREGKTSGRLGRGGCKYPLEPGYQVGEMLFPELPHHSRGELKEGVTISITKGRIAPGASSLTHSSGRQTFTTRATPLGGSRVQLAIEKRFDPDNGTAPSLSQYVATFDHRLGAVIDHVAKWAPTKNGVSYTVNQHVRRINNGAALDAARQLAMKDAKSMPKNMEPMELMRKRLDLRLPKRYDRDNLPAPGTVVGYYDSEFPVHDAWYAAQFVKRIDRDKVLVRYLGSGETERIRPGAMAQLNR